MKKILLRINKGFWILFVLAVMLWAKSQWSQFDEYTWYSFFTSVIVHGGFGLTLYLGCAELIDKLVKE